MWHCQFFVWCILTRFCCIWTSKIYGWRGRWEGGLGWGIHVTPWLIHVNVWQNPLKCCEVISLQLIKKKKYSLSCVSLFHCYVFLVNCSFISIWSITLSFLCFHSSCQFIWYHYWFVCPPPHLSLSLFFFFLVRISGTYFSAFHFQLSLFSVNLMWNVLLLFCIIWVSVNQQINFNLLKFGVVTNIIRLFLLMQ